MDNKKFQKHNTMKDYSSVDAVKFIMSIIVVAIHVDPFFKLHGTLFWEGWMIIRRFAVPFFFLTTGYFLYKKNCFKERSAFSVVLCTKIKKFIKTYIIAMVVYTPLAILFFVNNNFGLLKSIFYYLRGFFLWGEQYNSWQLWTILATIYSLITMLFMFNKKSSFESNLFKMILFGILMYVGIDFFLSATVNNAYAKILKRFIEVVLGDGRIFWGCIYIPGGFLLAAYEKKFSYEKMSYFQLAIIRAFFLVLGGCIAYCSSFFVLKEICIIICSIIFFKIVINSMYTCDKKHAAFMRSASVVIYFSHMYVWVFICYLFYNKETYGVIPFVVTIVVTVLITIILEYVSRIIKLR